MKSKHFDNQLITILQEQCFIFIYVEQRPILVM